MDRPPAGYLSYLLRLRYADNDHNPVWRITLQSPDRAHQHTFRSLEELASYLQSQMTQAECPPSKETDP
jgi:hypothetical protein